MFSFVQQALYFKVPCIHDTWIHYKCVMRRAFIFSIHNKIAVETKDPETELFLCSVLLLNITFNYTSFLTIYIVKYNIILSIIFCKSPGIALYTYELQSVTRVLITLKSVHVSFLKDNRFRIYMIQPKKTYNFFRKSADHNLLI